jgi:ATP-binding cassette subfamily A (ABC1) protein 3
MPLSGRDAEINKLIDDIGLSDKRDSLSGQLSGGNKRKLSVAIAVCGGSKLIILDEPSSGLDIQARRELWTLLLKYRKDRVILLTTHYMDEAEFLSHRIAILDSGKVRALGSPVFLKNAFGCGYNLKLDVNQDNSLDALDYVRGFFGNDI